MASKPSPKQPTQEQIVNGFNELRTQQRQLAAKVGEITDERKEYQLVLDTLQKTEKDRTCYRMVGGVLVQKTVGELLPMLEDSINQMAVFLNQLDKKIEEKGAQLVEYREKHSIKLQGEAAAEKPEENKANDNKTSGVLVTS